MTLKEMRAHRQQAFNQKVGSQQVEEVQGVKNQGSTHDPRQLSNRNKTPRRKKQDNNNEEDN